MKYTYGKNLICKGADIRIVAATKKSVRSVGH